MIQAGVVQGIDKALARYDKKGTIYFALYCGSDKIPVVNGLSGRWEDMSDCVSELREYFEDITPDHKKIYSIVWYEDLVKPDSKGKISEMPIGSIKFVTSNPEQIAEYIEGYQHRQAQYMGGMNNEVLSRLSAIETKLNEEYEEEGPEEKPNVLAGVMQDPNVINFIVGTVQTIIDRILPPKTTITGIAGVEGQTKLDQAIEILKKHDDKLEDHLMILAEMAVNQPTKFKMLISML